MKKFINRMIQSNFIKNILTLVSGATIGYAINFITLPLISRVYTPGELGEYDLIISTAALVIDVFCLGMLTAIMLPKDEKTAISLCKIIRISVIFLSSISLIAAILLSNQFQLFDISSNYYLALFGLYLYIIVYNIQNIYFSYVNRQKKYHVLFWNQIINSSINVLVSLVLGILGFGTIGYLFGAIIAMSINTIYMHHYVRPFGGSTDIAGLKKVLYEYRTFPMIQMPANFLATVAKQMPIQFLGRIFGSANLGGYTMACKILNVPVSLIAAPVNRVYYRTATEKVNNNEDIGDFIFTIIDTNIKIAIVPIMILMLWGENILPFFLGEEWRATGSYMPVLGIYYLVLFCTSCLSGSFVILNKKKMNMLFACLQLLATICIFTIVSVLKLELFEALVLYVSFDMIIQLLSILLIFYFVKFSLKKYLLMIIKYILGSYLIFAMIKIIMIKVM